MPTEVTQQVFLLRLSKDKSICCERFLQPVMTIAILTQGDHGNMAPTPRQQGD